jgi:hypothetical protein
MPLSWIFLANYGCSASRSYATSTQATDYAGVSEAAGLLAPAECHASTGRANNTGEEKTTMQFHQEQVPEKVDG